jgi:hypothetical protein
MLLTLSFRQQSVDHKRVARYLSYNTNHGKRPTADDMERGTMVFDLPDPGVLGLEATSSTGRPLRTTRKKSAKIAGA